MQILTSCEEQVDFGDFPIRRISFLFGYHKKCSICLCICQINNLLLRNNYYLHHKINTLTMILFYYSSLIIGQSNQCVMCVVFQTAIYRERHSADVIWVRFLIPLFTGLSLVCFYKLIINLTCNSFSYKYLFMIDSNLLSSLYF